jgi:hypothetical protein
LQAIKAAVIERRKEVREPDFRHAVADGFGGDLARHGCSI